MDPPDQGKKRKTLTALSSHSSSSSATTSSASGSRSTSPYFANAPTSTTTGANRGRGGLGLGLRRGLANTQQQQPPAVPQQAAPTPAAPPKPQSRPLALQQRQRQQPIQTQTQTQLQLQPQQRTPSPPQTKPPQPTPAPAPPQPRQPTLQPPTQTQAPRGGHQEQEYRAPGLEAMRWMDEPPAAEPHAKSTSTASQQQQPDIAFLVTPPTLNLLRCLQPEFIGPPVIHPSAMLSRDQVEELFGSLLRVLDDTRPTADSSKDDEVVFWQARSLTAAEWKDGFAGALRPLLRRVEGVQALVARCPSAALCRTLLHHYLPALLAGSAAHSTTPSSSSSSSSPLQGLLHSLLQGSGGLFGDGGPATTPSLDRLASQLLPILSSFSCASSASASAPPPQKKPRTK